MVFGVLPPMKNLTRLDAVCETRLYFLRRERVSLPLVYLPCWYIRRIKGNLK